MSKLVVYLRRVVLTPPSGKWALLLGIVVPLLAGLACGGTGASIAPSVHKVVPAIGRAGEATMVTISGLNLMPGVRVLFGELEAAAPELVGSKTIHVQAPSQGRGRVGITVVNPDGGSSNGSLAFRYVAPPFEDVAAQAGVAFSHYRDTRLYNLGGGAAAGDFDGDGKLDIFVTNSDGPNALFRNLGDGTFEDVALRVGLAGPAPSANGAGWADYDNDGDLDLFVSTYGDSRLYRNDGPPEFAFTDMTSYAGVSDPDPSYRTTGVSWGDYDGDGLLDLMTVRHYTVPFPDAFRLSEDLSYITKPLSLYHNNGDGTFSNVTELLGQPTRYPSNVRGIGFKPGFLDYDNDGDLDIYVVNDFGELAIPNVLWRNDGPSENGWLFADVSDDSRSDLAIHGMALAVGDYDNDEDLDLYVTNIGASRMLRNEGDGTFSNQTGNAGVGRGAIDGAIPTELNVGWGAGFLDFDNDGLLDLYMVAGFLDTDPDGNPAIQPNALFVNNGDGTFDDISPLSGVDDPGIGRDLVIADFNEDGCLDIFLVNMGNEWHDPGVARLFQNVCDHGNNWLSIRTVGAASNRDGIGARVRVTTGETVQIREVGASQGHMSHHVQPVHFGLGKASVADLVEVRWPSGRVQRLVEVAANQSITLAEP